MKTVVLQSFDRYAAQVRALLQESSRYDNEMLNKKNGTGWSALQTMYHLILVEENSMRYLQKKLSYQPDLKKAGAASSIRGFLLWLFLRLPIKFKAPRAAGSEAIPEQSQFADVVTRWEASLSNWEAFFKKMPEELAEKSAYKHPRAGRIGWLQMLAFFQDHLQRHARQIRRAIAAAQAD